MAPSYSTAFCVGSVSVNCAYKPLILSFSYSLSLSLLSGSLLSLSAHLCFCASVHPGICFWFCACMLVASPTCVCTPVHVLEREWENGREIPTPKPLNP